MGSLSYKPIPGYQQRIGQGREAVLRAGLGTETSVATYAYDTWGVVTINTESFANGWHNPYLYDGRDGVRYDGETGLYWMSVRAYDPSLGRFIARDPLGRAPIMWPGQPYVYAGNNPLLNVDPSGQRIIASDGGALPSPRHTANWGHHGRIVSVPGNPPVWWAAGGGGRFDGKDKSVWYWKDNRADREAWMGPVEPDTRGWHFNLHVAIPGSGDVANYHVYYIGEICDYYRWYVINTDGRRTGFSDFFDGQGLLEFAAAEAAAKLASRIKNMDSLPGGFEVSIMGWLPFEQLFEQSDLPRMMFLLTLKPASTVE